MQNTLLTKKKKNQKLLIILIVVIIITVLNFVRMFASKEDSTKQFNVPLGGVNIVAVEKTVDIDFNVLKNPLLQELKKFELVEVVETEKGRTNPYNPYYEIEEKEEKSAVAIDQ